MQDCFFWNVTEVYIVENNITCQTNIFYRTVSTVGMLPCPNTCVFWCFRKDVIFFLGIYKCYISLICFRFLIQEREDSLAAGKCHYNGIKLLTYLRDRHIKALIEG